MMIVPHVHLRTKSLEPGKLRKIVCRTRLMKNELRDITVNLIDLLLTYSKPATIKPDVDLI